MRTTDIKVCESNNLIHGVRLALRHDDAKDPQHTELLDSYYTSS